MCGKQRWLQGAHDLLDMGLKCAATLACEGEGCDRLSIAKALVDLHQSGRVQPPCMAGEVTIAHLRPAAKLNKFLARRGRQSG